MVIPKKETDYVFDLEDSTLSGLILFSKKVAKAIESVISCNRVGVTVIGLEVPHAHIHLIPISSEKDMSFSNPKLQLDKKEFEDIAASIREAFEQL